MTPSNLRQYILLIFLFAPRRELIFLWEDHSRQREVNGDKSLTHSSQAVPNRNFYKLGSTSGVLL